MTIKVGDILFVDTNILLTATDDTRQQHQDAQTILGLASRYGVHLAVSGQILREYLVVATRPSKVNGLGLSPNDALKNIGAFRRILSFYDESESVLNTLVQLVKKHDLSGKRIHDANVVATMLTHGIEKVVTENPKDFKKFAVIEMVSLKDAARFIESQQSQE